MSADQIQLLFVCLGNICRSPLAEGICRYHLEQRNFSALIACDSCGTGHWHIGEPPHRESVRVAKERGVSLAGQKARQVRKSDLKHFDLIIAMDRQNRADLYSFFSSESEKIVCLREYDPEADSLDVPDPYYGGTEGFQEVFEIIDRSMHRLLQFVEKEYLEQ